MRYSLLAVIFAASALIAADAQYFTINVVDEQTGRGVPLIELRTVSELRYVTDSNGVVAFFEPGLLNQRVFFAVKGHGYEIAPDAFGSRVAAFEIKSGGSATIKIKRINIAERLYRITGEGIYRDSVLVGKPVPLKQPLLNAQVSGQDSVQLAEYRGKLRWFWGDTNRPAYPLGHYGTSGATSQKPGAGGLDPSVGIDLTYFTDKNGFSRKMVAGDEPGMKWIEGLFVIKDKDGRERMICECSHHKTLTEVHGRMLLLYNDETDAFELLTRLQDSDVLYPVGHAFRHRDGGQEYIYFAKPYALVRVKADFDAVKNPREYEGFTCLKAGSRYDKANPTLDLGADGKAVWGWKKDTASIGPKEQNELIAAKRLAANQAYYRLKDAATGKAVQTAVGSINYNAYRKKWIMIFHEHFGKPSLLGEVWYAEAETPEGPWERAHKIVTHEKYSFYNVRHHPEFDQDGGRVIFFEGTYTSLFAGEIEKTPLYDYNQIMYRLDLGDARLK